MQTLSHGNLKREWGPRNWLKGNKIIVRSVVLRLPQEGCTSIVFNGVLKS